MARRRKSPIPAATPTALPSLAGSLPPAVRKFLETERDCHEYWDQCKMGSMTQPHADMKPIVDWIDAILSGENAKEHTTPPNEV